MLQKIMKPFALTMFVLSTIAWIYCIINGDTYGIWIANAFCG